MTRKEWDARPRRESVRKRLGKLADRVLLRDGGRCVYCGEPATTLDHVRPRHAGGADHRTNLVSACLSCNSRRQHRPHRGPALRRLLALARGPLPWRLDWAHPAGSSPAPAYFRTICRRSPQCGG